MPGTTISERLKPYDSFLWGMVTGLFGSVLSFFLLAGITLLRYPNWDLAYFINDVFLGTRDYISPILSFCLVLDVPLFFLMIRWKMDRFAKGVLGVFFIFLPFIIYFRFF